MKTSTAALTVLPKQKLLKFTLEYPDISLFFQKAIKN